METETLMLGVVTQRKAIASRWQSHLWRVLAVLVDRAYDAAPPQCLLADADDQQWRFTGLELQLHSDEAEGYFLNATATTPCWFVMSRPEEIDGAEVLVPKKITLSYNEAARLMDGGEQVETLPAPAEIVERLHHFVATWYRPEDKRKRKKPSFEGGAGVDLMARAEGNHGRQ
ncbi:MAG: DUF3305 domain-containing protein [Herminiimonas sp.]|nr:DUF3305 domain-containing protein [Herminiimonas sp.]